MTPATQESYKKLSAHFYATHLNGEAPSPKRITDALKATAADYRPAYWRRLRNAIAFDQRAKGFDEAAKRIDATKNPITKDGATEGVKPKQVRAKRVSEADDKRLMEHFSALNDPITTAALFVTKYTGARPVELKGIEIREGRVFIAGAKKSHDGKRGADRELVLPAKVVSMIEQALPYLKGDIGPVQDRVRSAGKKLWPQRKAVPSLYSWRHQLGAELKASGVDRVQVAYLMGHQATESVDRYGNSRTAKGGRVMPSAPCDADLSSIRVDHTKPPVAAVAAIAAPANARSAAHDSPHGAIAIAARLLANGGGLKTGAIKMYMEKGNERQGLTKG